MVYNMRGFFRKEMVLGAICFGSAYLEYKILIDKTIESGTMTKIILAVVFFLTFNALFNNPKVTNKRTENYKSYYNNYSSNDKKKEKVAYKDEARYSIRDFEKYQKEMDDIYSKYERETRSAYEEYYRNEYERKASNINTESGSKRDWFDGCKSMAQAEKRYKKLSQAYHPDMEYGDEEIMKDINRSFEEFKNGK